MTCKREKMSKSRGNVVTIDEVVYLIHEVDDAYEFRDKYGTSVDHRNMGVWRDKGGDFFTNTRSGKQPIFLCEKGNPSQCILLIDGQEKEQHACLLD